jgi:hypothetical protein
MQSRADSHADEDVEAEAFVTDRAVYTTHGVTTTVTTAALDFFPDPDNEDRGKDDGGSSSSAQELPEDGSEEAAAFGRLGSGSCITGRGVLRHSCVEGSADNTDFARTFPTGGADEAVRD